MPGSHTDPLAARLRAGALFLGAAAAGALTWRLRPGPVGHDPVAGIVTGCAWLAWLLAGWLVASTAICAAGHLGHLRSPASRPRSGLRRCVPSRIARPLDLVITVGLVGTLLGGGIVPASGAAARTTATAARHPAAAPDPFEWPGLPDRRPVGDRPGAAHPERHRRPAPVGLVSAAPRRGGPDNDPVTVRSGDTLWSLAADRLGANATTAQIAAAWPRWYAVNRRVIGADPSLILPVSDSVHRPIGQQGAAHDLRAHHAPHGTAPAPAGAADRRPVRR